MSETGSGYTLRYYYDGAELVGFNFNNQDYFYEKNLQGDITGIYNTSGTLVGSYSYDAWGKCRVNFDSTGAAFVNPFRYRGYYYDRETGLYYLNSRYYDPNTGRFINTDIFVSNAGSLLGYNCFTYCFDNPVNMIDSTGNQPKFIEDTANSIANFFDDVTSFMYDVYYRATAWHFEDRINKNGVHPTYEEVVNDDSWRLLPEEESQYHDNGFGKPELKYVHEDGREAVFDGDTLLPITDERYIATYNYCVLKEIPKDASLLDYIDVALSYLGHGILDVVPYHLTGQSNTREQFEENLKKLGFYGKGI